MEREAAEMAGKKLRNFIISKGLGSSYALVAMAEDGLQLHFVKGWGASAILVQADGDGSGDDLPIREVLDRLHSFRTTWVLKSHDMFMNLSMML